MAGPESLSAGAAIKGFNRVKQAVSWIEFLSGWILLIERMHMVVFLFVFLKLGCDCPSVICGGLGQFRTTSRRSTLQNAVCRALGDGSTDSVLDWVDI